MRSSDSFSRRMWHAVAFIERNPYEVHRQLDAAFESHDGDAMCAALYTLAAKRPRLAELLPKYVTPPSDLSEAKALVGKPMAEIRKAAADQRRRGQAGMEAFLAGLKTTVTG